MAAPVRDCQLIVPKWGIWVSAQSFFLALSGLASSSRNSSIMRAGHDCAASSYKARSFPPITSVAER
jgi:hypothetical protein